MLRVTWEVLEMAYMAVNVLVEMIYARARLCLGLIFILRKLLDLHLVRSIVEV
jgi:hypothetical protein